MRTTFKRIPAPLQKQILIRLGFGALFFVLLIALLFTASDVFIWLPGAGACVFFFAAALALFRRAVLGDYVVVSGVCKSVGLTTVRRRVKFIVLQTDKYTVKVSLHSRIRKIPVGTAIDLYVAKNTPIYEKDNMQMLYQYLAMDCPLSSSEGKGDSP